MYAPTNTPLTSSQAERLHAVIDNALLVAWDGCHKIYLAMDKVEADWFRAEYPHTVGPHPEEMIAAVERWWEQSCFLRFVNSVSHDPVDPNRGFTDVIPQFDEDDEDNDDDE